MRHPDYGGIVSIEEEPALACRRFPIEGHWELPGLDRGAEEGPGWTNAADAIAWGRRRAPRVWLRVHQRVHRFRYVVVDELLVRLHAPTDDDQVIYSAGEEHGTDPELRRWPGAPASRDADIDPQYGGTVWLVQWAADHRHAGPPGLVARWERVVDGVQHVVEVAGPSWDGGEEAAVAWARERAPYVLLCNGPRRYGYLSAGEHDPPGLDLPRWQSFEELRAELRASPPTPPAGTKRWIQVREDPSRSFPLTGPEPA